MFESDKHAVMKSPDNPANEKTRLKDLRSLGILDTRPEERFDRLTRMAKRIFDVDIALVEDESGPVAYCRASWEDVDSGTRDLVVFAPTLTSHSTEELFVEMTRGQERHMTKWIDRITFITASRYPGCARSTAHRLPLRLPHTARP